MDMQTWIIIIRNLVVYAVGAVLFFLLPLTLLIHAARSPRPKALMIVGAVLLAALLIPTHIIIGEPPGVLARELQVPFFGIIYLLPTAGLGVGAALLLSGINRRLSGGAATASLLLAGLLIFKSLTNLHGLLAWDRTTDPLEILLLVLPMLVALTLGGLLLVDLQGRLKGLGLTYFILVPALLAAIYAETSRIDIYQRTEANAQEVAAAVEDYHARNGQYPERLEQLSPLYALAHPRPWIIYGQDWCYQGEAGGYRLGYVFREHWSSPNLSGRAASQAGTPPDADLCADEMAALAQRDPIYRIEP